MRLTSTSFTHASTVAFGIAVAGFTVARLVSYAAPHLPGHDVTTTNLTAPVPRPAAGLADPRDQADRKASRAHDRAARASRSHPRTSPAAVAVPVSHPSASTGSSDWSRDDQTTRDGTSDDRASAPTAPAEVTSVESPDAATPAPTETAVERADD